LRNPILNARQIASLDLYSGGRVVYGVGVGWLEEEALAMGMPWDRRGARSDEHIAVLRALWGAQGPDPVAFEGTFHSFPEIDPDPRPTGTIPVLVGGHSEIAMDRAARLGDGWIAAGMSPERLGPALETLRTACAHHGRDLSELWLVSGTRPDGSGDSSPTAKVNLLRQYEKLGIHHVQVSLAGSTEQELLDDLSRWGDEILPQVH
jgi:alkanesulfonate monooxygenase SsuD/methylene tetrahydromethanopterin reductase-like flavin-dependent oxidoreductase (luciferase family)